MQTLPPTLTKNEPAASRPDSFRLLSIRRLSLVKGEPSYFYYTMLSLISKFTLINGQLSIQCLAEHEADFFFASVEFSFILRSICELVRGPSIDLWPWLIFRTVQIQYPHRFSSMKVRHL